MTRNWLLVLLILSCVTLNDGALAASLGRAQSVHTEQPSAQDLIAKVKQRYATFSSYHDEGTMRLFYVTGGKELQRKDNFVSYYAKGQKFKIQGQKVGPWGTTTLYVLWGKPECYAIYREDRKRGWLEYVDHGECVRLPNGFHTTWIGEVHGSAQAIIFPLFYSQINHQFDKSQAHFEVAEELKSYKLKLTIGQGVTETTTEYWIEKESYLIRHVEIRDKHYKTLIDYKTISIDQPLSDEAFTFEMPEYALAFSHSMRDKREKQERLHKLAAKEMPEAQMALLAENLLFGGSGTDNFKNAMKTVFRLADKGYLPAQSYVAHFLLEAEPVMLPSPYDRLSPSEHKHMALQYLEKAGLACDIKALESLVDGYSSGSMSIERNAEKAYLWYQKKEKCVRELMPQ